MEGPSSMQSRWSGEGGGESNARLTRIPGRPGMDQEVHPVGIGASLTLVGCLAQSWSAGGDEAVWQFIISVRGRLLARPPLDDHLPPRPPMTP